MIQTAASSGLAADFRRDGFVVVRGAVSLSRVGALTEALRLLIVARLRTLEIEADEALDLDEAFGRLEAAGEAHIGEIFRVIRETAELYNLILDPDILGLVRALVPTRVLHVLPEAAALRVDRKVAAKRAFHWHHDYSYITMSENGVTAWFPLVKMSPELGYLRVVPGSHKEITPVRFKEEFGRSGNFTGHNVYELYGVSGEELEPRSVDVEVDVGDVLIIHGCLLHRSGHNQTPRGRWTILGRYGDALEPALVSRAWRTVRDNEGKRLFNELHPELVHEG